jgi:hypothetical protein
VTKSTVNVQGPSTPNYTINSGSIKGTGDTSLTADKLDAAGLLYSINGEGTLTGQASATLNINAESTVVAIPD